MTHQVMSISEHEKRLGLVNKFLVPAANEKWVIQEEWDVTNPRCPYHKVGSKKGEMIRRIYQK